jgi:hypothetical protein
MRMTRENLRGELLVSLEAVSAVVKAYGMGAVEFEAVDTSTRKDAVRYAPSFIPGKVPDTPGVPRPYTADGLARFLGGVYARPNSKAQPGVLAALGILEMEERKVIGFSERVLRDPDTEEGVRYLGAKKIIKIVSEVKEKEVKIAERHEEVKKANDADAVKMRELQAQTKAREDAAEAIRQLELAKLKAAREAEDKAESDRLFLKMKAQGEAQIAKALADKGKLEAVEARVAERKRKEEEARGEDAYAPIRRDVERALFKMDNVSTGSFCEDVKSLAKRKLSLKDRQRLWESASALADWYGGWVCSKFVVAPDQLQPKRGTISKRRTK